jgi:hypothetical protein
MAAVKSMPMRMKTMYKKGKKKAKKTYSNAMGKKKKY